MSIFILYAILMAIVRMCVGNDQRTLLVGTNFASVVAIFVRSTAHTVKHQALAQQVAEFTIFTIISMRLYASHCSREENVTAGSFETKLLTYGLQVVRPLATSFVFPTMPVRLWLAVLMFLQYSAHLFVATTDILLHAKALSSNNNGLDGPSLSSWDVQLCLLVPTLVFALCIGFCMVNKRQSRLIFESMTKQQTSHALEVAATRRAAESEQRAHEAERRIFEENLQQRNKYLGAMCHDFGTPVAVLKMLLSMMRKRVKSEQQRQIRAAAAKADRPNISAAEANTSSARPNTSVARPNTSAAVSAATSVNNSDTAAISLHGGIPGSSSGTVQSESFDDSARMLDLIRRASAGLELLEVTRQKAIAFSKLQTGGRLVPDCKPFEVAELLRKSASIARDTGKSERVEVETHTSGELPLVVSSDADWLFMILVNFASNSMKHTSRGRVSIRAMRTGHTRLRLEVSDSGSGVPADFVTSLFKPFSSASTTVTSVESTGLGLYHSKQLASILGGRVGYRPNAAGGATFVVEVPITFVSAAKTQEVLAKNRLELEGLVETAASPEDRARAQVQRRPAPSARGDRGVETVSAFSSATTMMASAAATSTTPSPPAPTANAPAASARGTEGVTQNVDALATVTAHDGGGGVDSATARDGGQSSQSPRPSPRALASPRQDENALTSEVLAPSVLLTSLLSRVPPPLLVDDSELSRVRMSVQLNAWAKVEAMETESGDKALHILTAAEMPLRPSVVLISVNMAGRSGVETCRAIRAWEHSRGVAQHERLRIVGLLTLTNDAAGRAACLDAGMDDALPKPFDAAALGCCLEKLMP